MTENLFLPAAGKLEADLSCEIYWLANDGGGYFVGPATVEICLASV